MLYVCVWFFVEIDHSYDLCVAEISRIIKNSTVVYCKPDTISVGDVKAVEHFQTNGERCITGRMVVVVDSGKDFWNGLYDLDDK